MNEEGEWEEEVKLFALCCSDGLTLEADGWASPWEPYCRSLLKEMPKHTEQKSRDGILGKVQSEVEHNCVHFTWMSTSFTGSRAYLLPCSSDYLVFSVADMTKDARSLTLQHTRLIKQLAKYSRNALVRPRQELNLSFPLLKRRNAVVATEQQPLLH